MRWAAPSLALALSLCTTSAFADDALEQERTELYRDGTALAAQGDWAGAVAKFRKVVELRSAPKALIALAVAEEHLGHLTAAKRLYAKAVADANTESLADDRKAASDALAQLDPRVPSVTLGLPSDASLQAVSIDGSETTANASGDYEIDPGPHTLVVRATDGRTFQKALSLRERDRAKVVVTFAAAPAANANAPAAPPAAEGGSSAGGLPLGPIVLGAAGIVSAGAGVVLWVLGENQQNDVKSQCAGTTTCASSSQSQLQPEIDASRSKIYAGDVLVGLGAAAVAGGALWYLLDGGTPRSQNASAISFEPRSGGAWLGWRGTLPF